MKTHGLMFVDGRIRPEYNVWHNMKKRCISPNYQAYKNYGGRGIKVCDRWLESFENFFADMGQRPSPKHSIDRINNNGNYEPGNCRWATQKEQQRNRSSNVYMEHNGLNLTMSEWAIRTGIPKTTLSYRKSRGLSVEQILCLKKRCWEHFGTVHKKTKKPHNSMKKRLFYTILLGIGIVFVPYWMGVLVHKIDPIFFNETSALGHWTEGFLCCGLLGMAILLIVDLIYNKIPDLIHWIKTGE